MARASEGRGPNSSSRGNAVATEPGRALGVKPMPSSPSCHLASMTDGDKWATGWGAGSSWTEGARANPPVGAGSAPQGAGGRKRTAATTPSDAEVASSGHRPGK